MRPSRSRRLAARSSSRSSRSKRRSAVASRPLVLCYHAVSERWEHRLSLRPDLLLRQVRVLLRFWHVRATFDDAFRSAAAVFPALRQLGVPVQVFVCTGYARDGAPLTIPELAGDDPDELATLTWDELRGHMQEGMDVGSHTVTHAHLPQLSDREIRLELSDSKAELEDRLGRFCSDLAYPYGEHDARVRNLARDAGYLRAYALWDDAGEDDYALPRLDLYRRHTPARAMLLASPARRFRLSR